MGFHIKSELKLGHLHGMMQNHDLDNPQKNLDTIFMPPLKCFDFENKGDIIMLKMNE